MGGDVACRGATRNACRFVVRNFKARDELGDMSGDRKIKITLNERW
jgi:hypothetical protein